MARSSMSSGWAQPVLRFLEAQSTGVLCALAASALLGVGSFVMDRLPDRYRGLHWDDLRFFFQPWRVEHVWLYALCLVLALWGLSALICTIQSVRSLVRRRVTRASAYGAPILHVSFVLALVAHLWGGVTASGSQHLVGPDGLEIHGTEFRPVRVQREHHPNGMPRQVTVMFSAKDSTASAPAAGADEELRAIAYNEPLVFDAGATELLLQRVEDVPVAVLRLDGRRITLRPGDRRRVGSRTVTLEQLYRAPSLRVPVVQIHLTDADPGSRMLPLDPKAAGPGPAFVGLESALFVLLAERRNPSVPLVFLVTVLLVVGVLLVAVERVTRKRSARQTTAARPESRSQAR